MQCDLEVKNNKHTKLGLATLCVSWSTSKLKLHTRGEIIRGEKLLQIFINKFIRPRQGKMSWQSSKQDEKERKRARMTRRMRKVMMIWWWLSGTFHSYFHGKFRDYFRFESSARVVINVTMRIFEFICFLFLPFVFGWRQLLRWEKERHKQKPPAMVCCIIFFYAVTHNCGVMCGKSSDLAEKLAFDSH